jgi:arylsulfatase A-like enzyme
MLKFIFISFVVIASGCNIKKSKESNDSNKHPNIIIILTDDQGYHDVGFNGCTDIPTPNIDRIASNGVMFTNGYVSYAVCGPSRAGLITGRYQDRFGFGRNPLFAPNDPNQGLPLSEQTLASALKGAGYRTMALGKWHLGAHKTQRPLQRGFDEFYGFLTGGHMYFPEKQTLADISEVKSQFDAYKTKLLHNNTRVDEKEYITDALSRETVRFIEKNRNSPFFIYLAYNAPHTPMQATEKYLSRFNSIKNKKRRTYAAMVSAVDDGVGKILDKLDELDITNNTIVFYLSDNGGPEKHNASDNGELREGKSSLYEGGIHVPFAVQWPGMIPANKIYEKPIISLDIFPTAIYYAGAKAKNQLDGVNIVPYLTGEQIGIPHDILFWRKFDNNYYAVRNGDSKLVKMNSEKDELYNLKDDIGEHNEITDNVLLDSLKKRQRQWNSEMIDPVFLGLRQNGKYNKLNPDRFKLEKY